MCQRRLGKSLSTRRVLLAVVVALPVLAVLTVLLASPELESILIWHHASPADAYSAAVTYLRKTPEFKGAISFSKQKDSVIERWGPMRYRVAGYVDLQPKPGSRIHNYYSCVLHYTGQNGWEVEDLHFERVR
jgi:hypothetical protein